ncbi:protein FANTASTIC FOUR 3-like [Impatiens glandulifera]|uniref:protein FANTASTIC FOUR 3-like n=1 Tax=Impatiens glandulifera TaxID=253017 RepID=UPI001FB0C794|nr:protein FANTASTIC FOUR 3-like [Impatiens glandulifera]
MSTVVYEGVHTNYRHESQFIETRTLTLKLSSPLSENRHTRFTQNERNAIDDSPRACWDFRNSLYNSSQDPKFDKETSSYVPPTTNKSLSIKVCLELCTENLGSESGSDSSDHSILSLLTSDFDDRSEKKCAVDIERPKQRKMQGCVSRSFPPPLTTMRGSNPIRVRPKREDGRLVIEAVEEPAACNYFRSERSHGRLRLCFWDDEEQVEQEQEDEENEGICDQEEEDDDDEEEEDEDEEEGMMSMDMIENNLNGGVEIGNQKFQRRSRCKEGGSCNSKGLCNWEPFLVAT